MQAIVTKTLPTTMNRPTRIKAKCQRGEITVSRHHPRIDTMSRIEDMHREVARMLCERFIAEDAARDGYVRGGPWSWPLHSGGLPDGAGFDFAHLLVAPPAA